MRFGWWPRGTGNKTASYRLRCAQIVQELQRRDVDCGVWAPGLSAPSVLVLSKRYDAESLRVATEMRREFGTRLVLDLCDNHFYASDSDPAWQRRADLLRHAVNSVDTVIASTPALAEVMRGECSDSVPIEMVGDAAELPDTLVGSSGVSGLFAEWRLGALARKLAKLVPDKNRRLVWFGKHASRYADGGMSDLNSVLRNIEHLHAQQPIHLTVISNSRKTYQRVMKGCDIPVSYLSWNARTFSRALRIHGTCVIPIGSNPFTVCKTNNRVATALLHDLSVVADSIPSYEEFDNFVSLNDWERGLSESTAGARGVSTRSHSGASFIRREYSLEAISQRWLEVLSGVELLAVSSASASPTAPLTAVN